MRRVLCLALIIAVLAAPFLGVQPAYAALGWVGNMWPAGGSINNVTVGGSFTVYVQVWKDGVTNFAGQGAGLSCTLHWSPVGYFGGVWGAIADTPMIYNGDVGNNDEYRATITPGVGLYEFTAFCTDTTDNATTYQGAGNGRLVVDTASGGCNTAAQGDNTVFYNGLQHDSFSAAYRNPGGAVPFTQGTVTLKYRTCMDDLNSAPVIRVWNDLTNVETITPLTFGAHTADSALGGVTTWQIDYTIPTTTTILYYTFRAADGSSTAYYRAKDKGAFYGNGANDTTASNPGGLGQAESNQSTAYNNSFQLTVYDPAFSVPGWMQRGVVYQIFPDRFRDGDPANNPVAGRFSYNIAGGSITRSNSSAWNTAICDPRQGSTACTDKYGDNFYGGDLAGITEKINQGYFDNLGVSVIYLNPIFRSPSNHKYDTADYLTIDPDFGSLADFQALAAAAQQHGLKLMLDGVFNHVSSDSKYFDRYSRYNAAGDLVSNGVGTDDDSGACEANASPYKTWFYFPDTGNPGKDGANIVYCNNDAPTTYEAWYSYSSLPKLQANSSAVRNLVWNSGLNSVGPYWVAQGANGWRFDVGGDVDPGRTADPANDYWEGFRAAVRSVYSQTLMLGEEWGDASPWLLGGEYDSVMNYRFRGAVLSWLFTSCAAPANGCTGGTQFEDNDANAGSATGPIGYLSPSGFNTVLRSIQEDYPPQAFNAMLNLEGSHDTNRVRYLLKKINNESDAAALQRLKEWWLFSFTYAGAPTLYYGDEIALSHDAVWSGSWQDDPYNRAPYPWPDTSGSAYSPVIDTLQFARKMSSIRWSYRALQDGDVQHGLIISDTEKVYGFARTTGSQTALIALNRDSTAHSVTFSNLNAAPYNLPDNTVLYDAIEGHTYTVTGGAVSVPVNPTWGVVLLEQNKIDSPQAVQRFSVDRVGVDNVISWQPVFADTAGEREVVSYQIHRGPSAAFTPDVTTLIATTAPASFGTNDGTEIYTDTSAAGSSFYRVVPVNSAARVATSLPLPAVGINSVAQVVPPSANVTVTLQSGSYLAYTSTGSTTYVSATVYANTLHPYASSAMLNRYYHLNTDSTDFTARLCLGYDPAEAASLTSAQVANLRLCRWTGAAWTCPDRSVPPGTPANVICAENVTAFSDWTLGGVGPDAVTLRDLRATDQLAAPIVGVLLIGLVASLAGWFIMRRRLTIHR